MGNTGTILLNVGILILGLLVYGNGLVFAFLYKKSYISFVKRHGRIKVGKEYGTEWTKYDERGVNLTIGFWTLALPITSGLLLFYLTNLTSIGIPLIVGIALFTAGTVVSIYSYISNTGLGIREAKIALQNLRDSAESINSDID